MVLAGFMKVRNHAEALADHLERIVRLVTLLGNAGAVKPFV